MQELGYNYRITDLQCALGRSQLNRLPEFIARRQEIASHYNQAFATIDWLQTPALAFSSPVTRYPLPVASAASNTLEHRTSTPWPVKGETSFTSLATRHKPRVTDPELSPPSSVLSHLSEGFAFDLPDLSLHLYTVQIDFSRLGKTRTEVMHELKEQGIGTQILYIPVYLQPWYRRTYGYAPGKCPKAEEFYTRSLSLPLYPSISDADVGMVINAVVNLSVANSSA